jgi:hypothetical protein
MPRFFFDVFLARHIVLDPGGMVFENPTGATATADEMARQLLVSRGAPRVSGGWVSVRDERGLVIYRSSTDPRN